MHVRMTIGGDQSEATVTLLDNQTARDFASLLPVTIDIHDHLRREKAGPLPRALANGQPQSTYQVGDVGYWPPSNDLAIYYDHDGQTITGNKGSICAHAASVRQLTTPRPRDSQDSA